MKLGDKVQYVGERRDAWNGSLLPGDIGEIIDFGPILPPYLPYGNPIIFVRFALGFEYPCYKDDIKTYEN